jgi:hypothetical protein
MLRFPGKRWSGPLSAYRPFWAGAQALERTLAYDAAILGDGVPPTVRLASTRQPTLVAAGGGAELFERAADAITANMPHARRLTVENQEHVADPKVLAPMLERFFGD